MSHMKIHVVHDDRGNILGFVVPGPDFIDTMGVVPRQGEQVSVVERPDREGEQLVQDLRESHDQFRVDASSSTPTLVKK